MIYMLSEDMGHFFQIWSLAISLHISCSVQFDAVHQLHTTNLEFSGEQQPGQNMAAVRTVPHHQYEVFCCPSRLPATCATSITEIRRKFQRWIFCETSLLRNSSLILNIGQNNLVLLAFTQAGEAYFFFQRYVEE